MGGEEEEDSDEGEKRRVKLQESQDTQRWSLFKRQVEEKKLRLEKRRPETQPSFLNLSVQALLPPVALFDQTIKNLTDLFSIKLTDSKRLNKNQVQTQRSVALSDFLDLKCS